MENILTNWNDNINNIIDSNKNSESVIAIIYEFQYFNLPTIFKLKYMGDTIYYNKTDTADICSILDNIINKINTIYIESSFNPSTKKPVGICNDPKDIVFYIARKSPNFITLVLKSYKLIFSDNDWYHNCEDMMKIKTILVNVDGVNSLKHYSHFFREINTYVTQNINVLTYKAK
jgi:hypothetical protein